MADLKEGVFADDASQYYDQGVLPPHTAGQPHEMSPLWQAAPKRQFLRPTFQVTEPSYSIKPTSVPLTKRQFAGTPASLESKVPLPIHPPIVAPPALRAAVLQPPVAVPPPTTPGMVSAPFSSPLSQVAMQQQAVAPEQALPPFALPANLPPLSPPLAPIMPMPIAPAPEVRSQKPGQKRQRKQKKPRKKMTRGRLIRRIVAVCSILTIIVLIFASQANGASGAWTADMLRSVFGPTITAQVKSWYLGFSDSTHQLQYKLSGQKVVPPWSIGTSPVVTTTPSPKTVPLPPMPLNRIPALVTPAIDGEGQWAIQGTAPAPYGYVPLDARAFIRPDPSHPYAIVTMLQFDTRFFRLHMVAGTSSPVALWAAMAQASSLPLIRKRCWPLSMAGLNMPMDSMD